MAVELIGIDKVLANLNKEIGKIEGQTVAGMRAALLKVKALSIVKTPVDTGNLRQSHFVDVRKKKRSIEGIIGAIAAYAIFVHEDLEAKHTVGEAKFLENAIRESAPIILATIAKFAKV